MFGLQFSLILKGLRHKHGLKVVLGLTAVTVGISHIHLPFTFAVILALVVASTKASLVGLYFMHLISEKTAIYLTLLLTAVLFVFLIVIPWMIPFETYRGWIVS